MLVRAGGIVHKIRILKLGAGAVQKYDVIVIGAGVIGSSVAYHLQRLGAGSVLVGGHHSPIVWHFAHALFRAPERTTGP